MTKKELIHYLEPFMDDIQIISYNDISGVCDIKPNYMTATKQQVDEFKYNGLKFITEGDGFIVI